MANAKPELKIWLQLQTAGCHDPNYDLPGYDENDGSSVTLRQFKRSPATPFRFRDIVGRYRLVVSDELLAFVERTFVDSAPEHAREEVRREALAEAALAELEIQTDGTVVSRSGAEEFYRMKLQTTDDFVDSLSFEKAPGHTVKLTLRDADNLVAVQPNKPEAVFARQDYHPSIY